MNEQELVERKFESHYNRFDSYLSHHNIAHSIFLSCLIHKHFNPSQCAKFLLIKDRTMYKVLCDTLSDFPEFGTKVKQDLEKYLVLL